MPKRQIETDKRGRKKVRLDNEAARESFNRRCISDYLDSEWSIIMQDKIASPVSLETSFPLTRVLPASWRKKPEEIVQCVFSSECVATLCDMINVNLQTTVNQNKVSHNQLKYFKKQCTTIEFWHFYAIIMLMENTYCNEARSMRQLFKGIRERYGTPIGFNRFRALFTSLRFSIEELQNLFSLLQRRCKQLWSDSEVVTIDETVYSYQVSKEIKEKNKNTTHEVPVVYIPRKPHPNGLLNYKMVTISTKTKLPYMLDFEPFLQQPQLSARDALLLMIGRLPSTHKPHICADSGFGSVGLLTSLKERGYSGTMSLSSNEHSFLLHLLKIGVRVNRWIACWNQSVVLSVNQSAEAEQADTVHYLGTTGFSFVFPDVRANSVSDGEVRYSHEFLLKKKRVDLNKICQENHLSTRGNKHDVIDRIERNCNGSQQAISNLDFHLDQFRNGSHGTTPLHHKFYRFQLCGPPQSIPLSMSAHFQNQSLGNPNASLCIQ